MTQYEDPRLLFGDHIPLRLIPKLRAWFKSHPRGRFNRSEREIHAVAVAAVAWADSHRPTIVQAHRILCSEDASLLEPACEGTTPVKSNNRGELK